MLQTRAIPCLLLKNQGLVKTVKFKKSKYIGDPINAIRIFNEKEVDELIFLDITAAQRKQPPKFDLISKFTSECFMPLCYGGGIDNIDYIKQLFGIGVEKVAINTAAVRQPELIKKAAELFGSQSIVVSIDAKKKFFGGYEVVISGGRKKTGLSPVEFAKKMEQMGAGEIVLNSVDRDGTMSGYDLELIREVTRSVNIPVIACGGAATIADLGLAVKYGAQAVAAGSLFVYQGKYNAVLINYPGRKELDKIFAESKRLK